MASNDGFTPFALGLTAAQVSTAISNASSESFSTLNITNDITVGGTVDGRDVAADGIQLDTNTSKLVGIAAGAQVNPSDAAILAQLLNVDGPGTNLDADTVDGVEVADLLRTDVADVLHADTTATTQSAGDSSLSVATTAYADNAITPPAPITDFTRCGDMYLQTAGLPTSINLTNSSDTYGPTGSSGANIEAVLDVIPAAATAYIFSCRISFTATTTSDAVVLYAGTTIGVNVFSIVSSLYPGAATGLWANYDRIVVPVNGDGSFAVSPATFGSPSGTTITFYISGYML